MMRCVSLGNITCLCAQRSHFKLVDSGTNGGEVLGNPDEEKEGQAVSAHRDTIRGCSKLQRRLVLPPTDP